jgi:tetratricopeptide (TPR) repeat protein
MQESVKRYAEGARREHGVTVRIRVGLNSGEVVVRAIGSDLHMDYTAVGQTTHLAARMEQLAGPGSILLSPATMELAEGYVEVKPLGPLPVKGLPEPVEVYELVGAEAVRSRLQAAAASGLTPFVGRDSEVDQLRQALEGAQAGHGQVVAVVGEPGVGKSRLYWEFSHSHRTQGWLMLESGSVSYGKATAYLPVIDLLKEYFHIEGRDDIRTIREKVTGKVLSLDRSLEPSLSALLSLLETPVEDEEWGRLDPPQRRQRTLDAVKRLLLRESQVQPLMLLVEDLHWIDAETQALLDSLVESLPTARLLLLVNYRPEYQHLWGSKTYYRQLRIDPLPPESADDLLTSLVGTDQSLDTLKRVLIERTEGNPLFLEESVRSLAETKALIGERGAYRLAEDAKAIQVPATVQAILGARIDRLPPEDKRLLQAASVIGKDVPFALLLKIADLAEEDLRRRLGHLQAAEFLYETSLFPDLEYTFKHALTHEVTYGGLLQERRRDLHARIVEAIETLHRDRLGEQIERLAHQAVRGEVREKAVHYLRQAGLKAAVRSALPEARVWFEQALGLLDALPESPSTLEQGFEIRLELRAVLVQLGEVRAVMERLRESEALALRLNDDRRRGRVCAFMTVSHALLGELDEGLLTGTRALEIAVSLGDLRLRLLTTTYLTQVHEFRGDYERAVELAIDNLAVLPPDWIYEGFGNVVPVSVYDRARLVTSLGDLGRFADAAQYEAEMLRLAGPTQNAFTVGLAHVFAGRLHLLKGDWAKARSLSEHAIAVVPGGERHPPAYPSPRLLRRGPRARRRSERDADPSPGSRPAPRASDGEGECRPDRSSLPLAGLCCSATRPARRGAKLGRPRSRLLSASPRVRGPRAPPARRHCDPSRPVRCRERRDPLPPSAGAGRAAWHASAHRALPPRHRKALPAHGQTRAGARTPHHRDDDVPRDGHALLAGADGGRDAGVGVKVVAPPHPALSPSGGEGIEMAPSPSERERAEGVSSAAASVSHRRGGSSPH